MTPESLFPFNINKIPSGEQWKKEAQAKRNERERERREKRAEQKAKFFFSFLLAISLFTGYRVFATKSEKPEIKKVKPEHSISRIVKPEELKKKDQIKQEKKKPISSEMLSPKTYEAFLANSTLMERLKENRDIYERAAEETGVDWKIIAAIHYREAELNLVHSTVSGEKLGTKNPDTHKVYYSLLESAIETGKIFKENLNFAYRRKYSLDEETLKRGFLAYNRGRNYVVNNLGPENSPYVMNFYNEKYNQMYWPDSEAEPKNQRGRSDNNYGALTVYKILEQAESEGRL